MKRASATLAALVVAAATAMGATGVGVQDPVDLSPRAWPDGELERYWAISANSAGHKEATGRRGIVAGTSGAVAVRAGLEALRQGGSAADAVLTTAMSQTVLALGCWVSFAGRMTGVYYEAATGEVTALNANYDVPRAETDPLSIPTERPSGRTALVPGFMAGAQSMHERYGRLPWASIFSPAIYLAEEGFVLRPNEDNLIRGRVGVLGRLPETREVFTHPDGRWYRTGDLFRQTALARTLRAVADSGAGYMYTGGWGERLVSALERDGGRMSMEDLAAYRPTWQEPSVGHFAGATVNGLQPPNIGGPFATEILSVLDAAGTAQRYGSYMESPDALYELMQASVVPWVLRRERASTLLRAQVPSLDAGPGRVSPEAAEQIWSVIDGPEWGSVLEGLGFGPGGWSEHSDAVVAVDEEGNVAAILHTINALCWGTTGIFVDGVSIPNSATTQRQAIADAGPGGRVSDAGPPTLVLRDGQPILASSATGGGNVTVNWQNIYNVVGLGMTPKQAVDLPNFNWGSVVRGEFPADMLGAVRARGIPVQEGPPDGNGNARGFWVGVSRDPDSGLLRAGVIRWLDGIALGY